MSRADLKRHDDLVSRASRRKAYRRRLRYVRPSLELLEDRRLLAQVTGVVWHDLDASGLQDPNEPGVPDTVVELFDSVDGIVGNVDDQSVGLQITGAAGGYTFSDVPPGDRYYLSFRAPAGPTFTTRDAGDEAIDSDVDSAGATEVFSVTAIGGEVVRDAGLQGSFAPFGFAFTFGDQLDDYGASVNSAPDGNLVLTGGFYGSVDFDPGPGDITITSAGDRDAFLASYTPSGALVWVQTIGGPLNDFLHADVLFDDAGRMFLAGGFQGTVDFDPGPASAEQTSSGGWDIFLLTLTAQGEFISVSQIGDPDPAHFEYISGTALDADGNFYATGSFEGTMDFDPGPGVTNLDVAGVTDAFFLKLDSDGQFVWVKKIGGAGWDHGDSLTLDAEGNIWSTGYYMGPLDFDPGPGVFELPTYAASELDGFVLKLDKDGNFVWAGAMGGTSQDLGTDILLDHHGNVFVLLNFRYAADVDPGPGDYQVTGAITEDVAVVKLDPEGTLIWARVMAGNHRDRPTRLAVDAADNVYTVGEFRLAVDFDPGPEEFVLDAGPRFDYFLSKLDASGNFVFARQLGDPNYEDYGLGLALDDQGNVYTTGQFNGTVDFDWSDGTYLATSAGGYDGFLWRMSQASLQGIVWEDRDGDGLRSIGEPGLAGAVVEVWSTADDVVGNDDDVSRGLATTDEAGRYEFISLADGVDYYVTVRVPAGIEFTAQQVGLGDELQSDVDALGRSSILPLGSGAAATVNAGVVGAAPDFGFAFGAGGTLADVAQQVARDEAGNIYVAGMFSGVSADVDPGADVRLFDSAGNSDVLVAKYTQDGILLWAQSFGGPGADTVEGLDLDERQNVYLSGSFSDTVDFDTGWDNRAAASAGGQDAYVVRLDEYGNLVWVRTIGGAGEDLASDVRLDPEGNVIVSGWFAETVDLDPGPGTDQHSASGSADGFVVKLTSDGSTAWTANFGGTGTELPQTLDSDPAGFVYVAGSFTQVADFDPGPAAAELTSLGGQDSFLTRLTPDGEFVWARSIAGSDDVRGTSLRVDDDASSYLVGDFRGQADLDPGPGAYQVTSAGAEDMFFVKLDAAGSLAYGGSIGGPGADSAGGVDVDAHGMIALSGAFSETADFDPSADTYSLTSAGETDAFVVRLSESGDLILARAWGGPGVDEARDVVVDTGNSITTVGRFAHLDGEVVDFDPGPTDYQVEESGATGLGDWFVSHLDFQTLRVTTADDSGGGTLREAIHIANALPGHDRIEFDIAGAGPHTIQPTAELPDILEAVVLDGTTQSGYAGTPLIELRGDLAGAGATGLTIRGSDSLVTGLVINRFTGNGIEINDAGTTNVIVAGNYIGTDLTGMLLEPNGIYGIRINEAAENLIGGSGPGAGNVIGGSFNNLAVVGAAATGNVIQGNYIGVTSDGTASLTPDWLNAGVSERAILIHRESSGNIIGGLGTGEGNVIAGHNGQAIHIIGGGSNLIAGNRIGTNAAGDAGIGNFRGLALEQSPSNAVVNNLVSGNYDGITVNGSLSANTLIRGNYVGTDVTGTAAISNLWYGINFVNDPIDAVIGGITEADRNLVSANGGDGIRLTGAGHQVYGNYVGTDITGMQDLGNENNGVYVSGGSDVRIGSGQAGAGNLLSGNRRGVQVIGDLTNVRVQGNLIGATADGLSALGNSIGVSIRGSGNVVGSDGDGIDDELEGNVIAASSFAGIELNALNTDDSDNIVAGNLIGTDITGSVPLGNVTGVFIDSMANVRIGGTTDADRNLISGNTGNGVMVQRMGSKTGVEIVGNYLGTDVTGTQPMGNGTAIFLDRTAGVVIGSPLPGGGNVISANEIGIKIYGTGSDHNVITGNYIGTNVDGTAALGNTGYGIHILGSTGTRVGGLTPEEGNVISGNYNGVYLAGDETTLQGNIIGLNVTGEAAVPNFNAGILVAGGYGTLIGGTGSGSGNVISGNRVGIEVSGGTPTENTTIQGNRIGTNSAGTLAVGNDIGVSLTATSWFWIHDVLIGGSNSSAGNLISGNTSAGIHLTGKRITGARIEGNSIGTTRDGDGALGNFQGVVVENGAGGVQIGAAEAGNLIAGNVEQVVIVGNAPHKSQAFSNGDWTPPAHQGWSTFPLPQGSENPFWVSASNNTGRDTHIGEAGGTYVRSEPEHGQTTEPVAYYADTKLGGTLTLAHEIHADGELVVTSVDGFDGRAGVEFFAQSQARGNRDRGAMGLRILDAGEGITGLRAFASLVLDDGTLLTGSPISDPDGLERGVTYTWRLDYDPRGGTSAHGEVVVEVFADGNIPLGTSRIELTAASRSVGASVDAFGLRAGGGEPPAVASSIQFYVDQLNYSRVQRNTVVGNTIGPDVSGTQLLDPLATSTIGIRIEDSGGNQIGGPDPGAGNLISGNESYGIYIVGLSDGNVIQGNRIGTDRVGLNSLGNGIGVQVSGGRDNLIGGAATGAGNLISGNHGSAAIIIGDGTTSANTIQGNFIGTDHTGAAALPNEHWAVFVAGSADNLIGGTADGMENVISGNHAGGIAVFGSDAQRTKIQGNLIGTDVSGTRKLSNQLTSGIITGDASGFQMDVTGFATQTVIGGDIPGAGNVIANSGEMGIWIRGTGASGNIVQQNLIGTDISGTLDFGNRLPGIWIDRAPQNLIGGTSPLARNVISGNEQTGVYVLGAAGNVIQGNYIGTDITGMFDLGNSQIGVALTDAPDTQIGGDEPGAGNLISGNDQSGILLLGGLTHNVVVQGNLLGTDATGSAVIPSVGAGVAIFSSGGNQIGGTTPEARNIVAGHSFFGIAVVGEEANGNVIEGNYVGTDITGTVDLGNARDGVLVGDGSAYVPAAPGIPSNTIIGGASAGAGNLIAGNQGHGIAIYGGSDHVVLGNTIGVDRSGNTALGNDGNGILLAGTSGTQIGGTGAARNIISGNLGHGIGVEQSNDNRIQANYIGVAANGTTGLGNGTAGVLLDDSSGNVLGGNDPVAGNVIAYNNGPGIHLRDPLAASGEIRNNRVFGNLGRGIQLGDGTEPLLNDPGDTDGFLNFPVLTYAQLDEDQLTVSGFARPGAVIDLYLSAPTADGYGQGQTKLATLVEGSLLDSDAGTGSYGPGPVNGHLVGSDTTNLFSFTIPLPDEVSVGSLLTAVAIGSTSEFSAVVSVGDLAPNVPPVVLAGDELVELDQGQLLERDGSFIDDDSVSWTATVDYGDGTLEPLSLREDRTFHLEHAYGEAGTYTVTVTIVDNSLARGVDTFTVIVANEAPTATFNVFTITSPAAEGSTVTLQGEFTDPGLLDIHTIEIDWGDAAAHDVLPIAQGDRSFTATHVYIDDSPSNTARDVYRVQVTVFDDQGGQDTTPLGIYLEDIFNIPPQNLTLTLSNAEVDENSPVLLSGSFTDPGVLDTHVVSIDWGDGSLPETVELAENVLSFVDVPHVYPDNPDGDAEGYIITVEVVDDDEPLSPVIATTAVAVRNVVPFDVQLQTSAAQIQENGSITLAGSFTDPGAFDSHRVEIDWGDGSEVVVLDLPPSLTHFSGIEHRYADDSGAGSFEITVRVTDDDAPGVPSTGAATVQVVNAVPIVESLDVSQLGPVVEGSRITVSGTYSDVGPRDRHSVEVYWGAQRLGAASVDSTNRSYVLSYVLEDDDPSGTPWDSAPIQVRVVDDDGATGLLESEFDLRVDNVAPQVAVLPGEGSTETAVQLIAQVADPGIRDTFSYHWSVTGGGDSYEIIDGGPSFTLDRSGAPNAVYVVTLSVTDDDLGTGSLSMAVLVGTPNADHIVVTDDAFTSTGVNNLLVMGLGDADVIDATAVSAGNHVVLDGGDGSDRLYGGTGDDVFFLRGGDDQANVESVGGPLPNFAGDDRYYLVPNSTHTIVDTLGANALDFTFADFGVTFDLGLEDVPQDVGVLSDAGEHFVQISGTFAELVGSAFDDVLTGASQSTILAGAGADQLYVKSGTDNVAFYGGDQDDVLTVSGNEIGTVLFGGDDGADQLINEGSLLSLIFTGGADADSLLNTTSGSILDTLDFRGDDGADQLVNEGSLLSLIFTGGADADSLLNTTAGSILDVLAFRGDDGADQLINEGSLLSLVFTGGADADSLLNTTAGSILDVLDFRGDDGADQLINEGSLLSLVFTGGADADSLLNTTSGSILDVLDFRGDDGADQLINEGSLLSLVFTGGADADSLINAATGSVLGAIQFFGGDGADLFRNDGRLEFTDDSIPSIIFTGGADADTLLNTTAGSILDIIDFRGDDGADSLINEGSLLSIIFTGGADADTLLNTAAGSILDTLDFRGDDGADQLVNEGTLLSLVFTGGADADTLLNTAAGSILDLLDFRGDDGADTLINEGSLLALVFTGGADADTLLNTTAGSILDTLDFRGDDGADTLINEGSLLALIFTGGADADTLLNTAAGSILDILDFRGDQGDDVLVNEGTVEHITFVGGAGGDRFKNTVSGVQSLSFFGGGGPAVPLAGVDGSDLLVNLGDAIGTFYVEGGDGDDVVQNSGSRIPLLDLLGNDGNDTFINYGNDVALRVDGGAGADLLINLGDGITQLEFLGDPAEPIEAGDDTLLNYGHGEDSVGTAAVLFQGGAGIDAFQNDGDGYVRVEFQGGAGDDVLKNNASDLPLVTFEGAAGNDVFENNGNRIGQLQFIGGEGNNTFVDDGVQTAALNYEGSDQRDVLIANGDSLSQLVFRGHGGGDILAINGRHAAGVLFDGGSGDDQFALAGSQASTIVFDAGTDNDHFWVLDTAMGASGLQFLAGDGNDIFETAAAQVHAVHMAAGPGDDVFRNTGWQVANVTIEGGTGADTTYNRGDSIMNWEVDGGAGDDHFVNQGNAFGLLLLRGGDGDDNFINTGNQGQTLHFVGGSGNDALTNSGHDVQLIEFSGEAGDDRYQNNGDDILELVFHGGAGNDALQQNGQRIVNLVFHGEEDHDTMLLYGNDGQQAHFFGGSGADAWIMAGDNWQQLEFYGGDGPDVMRLDGNGIAHTLFDGAGSGDSLVYRGEADAGSQLQFLAGDGNDIVAFLGTVGQAHLVGDTGNDTILLSGNGHLLLDGGAGDDQYAFAGELSASVTLVEGYTGQQDNSRDTLDFSAYGGGPLQLDLALTQQQVVSADLELTLSDGNGIEQVIGTRWGDTIYGNDRDNYLAGADFAASADGIVAPRSAATQWVLLDFSSDNDAGEHQYSLEARNEIAARIEQVYRGPDPDQPWFNVRVTQDPTEIPEEAGFVTIFFNRTPSFDRPGGESSEVEFRNLNHDGYASVQINGLLGGIETAPTAAEDFMESRPEEYAGIVGAYKPAATDENFVLLAAKIAAHELGHLMGLRHYDAFGPIGLGLHAPPGSSEYKPVYNGPVAAFETFEHMIGSPASIGSDRFNDLEDLFFGEREAIKLTMATSEQSAFVFAEALEPHGDLSSAQAVPLVGLQVPNTLGKGLYHGQQLLVAGGVVTGQIDLDEGTSESDFYWFDGRKGDLVNIEVISQTLARLGPDRIDPVVRLWNSAGELVPYYESVAENDDEFETTDAALIDVRLPATGRYFIEVDTFRRGPGEPSCDTSQWTGLDDDAVAHLIDACQDTDQGRYELVVYTFDAANAEDGIDLLLGRSGTDQLEGGPGDVYEINLYLGADPTLSEGELFSREVTFDDRGGMSWTATIDYGDQSPLQTIAITDNRSFTLSHQYLDNGSYTIIVEVQNDDGLQDQQQLTASVVNQTPVITSITAPLDPQPVLLNLATFAEFTDAGVLDTHTAVWNWGDGATSPGIVTENAGSGQVSGSHAYQYPGVYTVGVTVTDNDGAVALQHYQYVVVYNPSSGFVSGGGTVVSPVGAYSADPLFDGQGTLGFVARYGNTGDVPVGHLNFRLNGADVRFASRSFDWLVVTDQSAFLLGEGTVNGAGSFQFLIAMADGGAKSAGEQDYFRLKIWEEQTSVVVYDSQPGVPDDAAPTTPLQGGNIIVHTGGNNLLATVDKSRDRSVTQLTMDQLQPVVSAAVAYWEATGFPPDEMQQLRNVQVTLADFADARLGHASDSTNIVWIDVDAAGYGWKLPDDHEVAQPRGMDLWRVVTHELGHMLGLEDLGHQTGGDPIMVGQLSADEPAFGQMTASPDEWNTEVIFAAMDDTDRHGVPGATPFALQRPTGDGHNQSSPPLTTGLPADIRARQPRPFVTGDKRRTLPAVWDEDWLGPEAVLLDQLAVDHQLLVKRRGS